MKQLINPDHFVQSEVNIQSCHSDDTRSFTKIYRYTEEIIMNHSKDFFFAGKSFRKTKKDRIQY